MPASAPARALVWAALLLVVGARTLEPGSAAELAAVRAGAGCALAPRSGPAALCACDELPADLRLLVGLPLPLDRASAAELMLLPGVGPLRARAIELERERGAYESTADLARVPGIGRATARRLAPLLHVGRPDPACSLREVGGVRFGGAATSRARGDG